MKWIVALAFVYTAGVSALSDIDAYEYLPELPISVFGCPSGPIALRADPDLIVPVVVPVEYHRGAESPASLESCERIVELVRSRAPSWYALVPDRFVCSSVRRHVHALWLARELNLGNHLWILDGHATGAGVEGFADELREHGIKYKVEDGRMQIVRAE